MTRIDSNILTVSVREGKVEVDGAFIQLFPLIHQRIKILAVNTAVGEVLADFGWWAWALSRGVVQHLIVLSGDELTLGSTGGVQQAKQRMQDAGIEVRITG